MILPIIYFSRRTFLFTANLVYDLGLDLGRILLNQMWRGCNHLCHIYAWYLSRYDSCTA
jgi:hypothetical protein